MDVNVTDSSSSAFLRPWWWRSTSTSSPLNNRQSRDCLNSQFSYVSMPDAIPEQDRRYFVERMSTPSGDSHVAENHLASSGTTSPNVIENHIYQNYSIPDLLGPIGDCHANCSCRDECDNPDFDRYAAEDREKRPTVGEALFGFMNKSKSISFRRKQTDPISAETSTRGKACENCTCDLDPVQMNGDKSAVVNDIYGTASDNHEYQNSRELILAMISQSRFLKPDYLNSPCFVNPEDLDAVRNGRSRTQLSPQPELSSHKNKLNLTINTRCSKNGYDPIYDFVINSPVIKKLRELVFAYPIRSEKNRRRLLHSIIAVLVVLVIILIILNVLVPKLLIAQSNTKLTVDDYTMQQNVFMSKMFPTPTELFSDSQPKFSTSIDSDKFQPTISDDTKLVSTPVTESSNDFSSTTDTTIVPNLNNISTLFSVNFTHSTTNRHEFNENTSLNRFDNNEIRVTKNFSSTSEIQTTVSPVSSSHASSKIVDILTGLPTFPADFQCQENQFKCITGISAAPCLYKWQRCDGVEDCSDGSDEMFCGVDALNCHGNFVCDDGSCLSLEKVCNGVFDCKDASDEMKCENVTCKYYEYRCPSGFCIPHEFTCDGQIDCPDHADEYNCSSSCPEDKFLCAEGWCIPNEWHCNGIADCASGEDEFNCSCSPDQMRCNNGGCVDQAKICDGILHCSDGSDEHDCVRLEKNVLIVREPGKQTFLPVCAQDWSSAHADLVCKQLSFSKSLWTRDINAFRGNFTEVFAPKFKIIPPINVDRTHYFLKKLPKQECKSGKFVKMECERYDCGIWPDERTRHKRIIGGKISGAHQWPTVGVLLHPQKLWACTATVLAPGWVVTSALCVTRTDPSPFDWKLIVGSSEPTETNPDVVSRTVKKFVRHPSYKFKTLMSDYDVMLVQLDDPLILHATGNDNELNVAKVNNANVAAICLPQAPTEAGSWCVTAGWGYTNPGGFNVNQKLKHLEMGVWLKSICNGTAHYPNFITDRMMCAGNEESNWGPCFNDEGAPLMCHNSHTNRWYLAGLLSYQNCDSLKHPSVYADVYSLNEWISDVLGIA